MVLKAAVFRDSFVRTDEVEMGFLELLSQEYHVERLTKPGKAVTLGEAQ